MPDHPKPENQRPRHAPQPERPPAAPQAGAEADDARALLAAIVDSSDDAIVSKTLDGFIRSWNGAAARMFGYTSEEVIGKSVLTIIPPELHYQEAQILAKIKAGERIDHFETVRVAKDGSRLDVSLSVSPVRNSMGQIIGVSKVARDITERRRTELQLQEAARRKDEFLAMLGHELRNPLAPIQHLIEVLRATSGAAGQEPVFAALDRQVKHMTSLLDDLLDTSRMTLGKIHFERKLLNVVNVIEQAVETNRPLIEARRHRLHLDIASLSASVNGDVTRLVQAFGNLLNNAAKYTPEGGEIRVSMGVVNGWVEVRIVDNGVGITRDLLPLIFDIFVQADRTLERAQGGLGLGLALVRRIVEQHEGSIRAFSGGPGKGSEFIVSLPAATDGSEPARGLAAPGRAWQPEHLVVKRVVIVDDNDDSRDALAMLIQLKGHEVFRFADGASALAELPRIAPDLVLLDIGLPGMNGYDVARQMRATGSRATLAAVTGYGQAEDRRRSREAGFDYHLVKPVPPETIFELLA